MIKRIIGSLIAFSIVFYANGQEESIDTITIAELPLRSNSLGGVSSKLESGPSLAEALIDKTSVYIKNYGPGSLATSSIRGGSAGHTLVLWNGLPIQNPFLGLLDLSLLDTWAMNKVELQKGGNSAMWGSGAIGGIIDLQQNNSFQGRLLFKNSSSYGSFERFSQKNTLALRAGALRFVTSYSYLQARNDFPYLLANDMTRIQSNAHQEQSNFNQEIYWTPNQENEITFHYWRSRASRQNPPTTVQNISEAFQDDAADRFSLQWKYFGRKQTLRAKTAYFIEDLNYFDPIQKIESLTHFETALIDLDSEFKIKESHIFNLGFSHFNTSVISPANYEDLARERKTAAFLRYRYKWFQVSGRQEIVDNTWIPFIPALDILLPISNQVKLKGKVSRNYRLPTLNDRFWVPGGNQDLLPESGWSQELTIDYGVKRKKTTYDLRLTSFNRSIDNWIQWTQDGPLNINKVWSRGIELESGFQYSRKNFSAELRAAYDYILSTSQVALSFPKINAGDQLFYTPIHQGSTSLNLKFKKIILSYRHRFTGSTLGINDDLEAFNVGDLNLSYTYKGLNIEAAVNNISDTQYRIIERRPMPGRNFQITINYTIKQE